MGGFLIGLVGAVLGAGLGALVGSAFGIVGALIGAPLAMVGGVVVAVRAFESQRADSSVAGALNASSDSAPVYTPLGALAARVQALEQEVGNLRREVRQLREGARPAAPGMAETQEAPAAPAPPQAPSPPAAPPVEAPAPWPKPIFEAGTGASPPPRYIPRRAPTEPPTDVEPLVLRVPATDRPSVAEPAAAEPAGEATAASPPATASSPPAPAREPAFGAFAFRAPEPPPPAPPAPPLRDRLPPALSRLLFGGNTIVKVGVLILFLGLAFLLRYAAERVTVPVEVRYAGVALIGVFLLGLGWRLRERKDAAGGSGYGVILQGAGIGVFYLTVLAAIKLNQLLPPEAAFAAMAVVAVLGAMLAVLQNAQWLALVAMAEGFAAPVLVSTGSGNSIALFSYLAILDAGIFLMAWHKAWRPLNLVGATATFALAAAWAQRHYTPELYASTQFFLLLFFVLFTAVGVLFARRALALGSDEPEPGHSLSTRALEALRLVGRVDSTLTFGVPLAAFGLQYLLVRDDVNGPAWAAFGFSLFYLLLGGGLLRRASVRYALLGEAYVIVSVIFGTLAIPLALEGAWTGATWAVEAAGMYWLGQRQQRPYARAFALLVLAGAIVSLLNGLTIDPQPGVPLVGGSVLGVLLTLGGVLAMLRSFAVGSGVQRPSWETETFRVMPPLAVAGVHLLAWMLGVPLRASVLSAWIAFACLALPLGTPRRLWQASGVASYGLALAGMASTLHPSGDELQLAGGWASLLAALLIGASLLAAAALGWRAQRRQAEANDGPPAWPIAQDIALLAGLAVMNLALLYAMPAESAAYAWPWIGLALLLLALRSAHPALALAWGVLQLAAGITTLCALPPIWGESGTAAGWHALNLFVCGALAGDMLQRHARGRPRWPSRWAGGAELKWGMLVWVLGWWSVCLPPELLRRLTAVGQLQSLPAVAVGWVLLTSLLMRAAERWRGWQLMGQAAVLTLPAWCAIALVIGPLATGLAPSASGGWLAWPLALLWHGLLLRQQRRWLQPKVLSVLHALGFWLFLLLAAREVQLALAGLGDPGSVWPTLGFMLVPALALGLISRPALQRRWPLAEQPQAYLIAGAGPLALYLLGWLWLGNLTSGNAAPLPYVPLVNPLELGQGLVGLALLLAWRGLPVRWRQRLPRTGVPALAGATAFALYTGLVLRGCHHLAGVPWEADALFASTLTQAALSIAWATAAVSLMLLGHRRARRLVWVLGASLLGGVVLKLFLVELADRGGLYRIVSFIAVGALLLLVGYFAPVPPRRAAAAAEEGA